MRGACAAAAAALPALLPRGGAGCSNVVVRTPGGALVVGRAMDSPEPGDVGGAEYHARVWNRGEQMGGALCADALRWENRFGFYGIDGYALTVMDGMNERGLTSTGQALGQSAYQLPAAGAPSLCYADLGAWALGSFATVREVAAALRGVRVVNSPYTPKSVAGIHWAMQDASGGSIVVEYIAGELRVHNNTVGVMTNDPQYAWHLENLNNYVHLSTRWPDSNDALRVDVSGDPWYTDYRAPQVPSAIHTGNNLNGLPGDGSAVSRFVRLFFLRQYATAVAPPRNVTEARVLVQGLLNGVFKQKGTIAGHGEYGGLEFTTWNAIKVPALRLYSYRTYTNHVWRTVDVSRLNLSAGAAHPTVTLYDRSFGEVDATADFA